MTISPERLRELIANEEEQLLNWHGRALCMSPEASERAKQEYRDRIAALRELEQARTTLEGVAKGTHVIVPREPTQKMICAGADAFRWDDFWMSTTAIYRAMLSAALSDIGAKP